MIHHEAVLKENNGIEKIAQETIDEARMVLPGIQALFGFQLIATFNERFRQLPNSEQCLHYAALVLVAIAIALIMTPAAYHRLVEQNSVSSFFIRLASGLIAAAMVPLMMAIAFEVYIVRRIVVWVSVSDEDGTRWSLDARSDKTRTVRRGWGSAHGSRNTSRLRGEAGIRSQIPYLHCCPGSVTRYHISFRLGFCPGDSWRRR